MMFWRLFRALIDIFIDDGIELIHEKSWQFNRPLSYQSGVLQALGIPTTTLIFFAFLTH